MTVKEDKISFFLKITVISVLLAVIVIIFSYQLTLRNHIYYGVQVAGIDLSGLGQKVALAKVAAHLEQGETNLNLYFEDSVFGLPTDLLKADYDLTRTIATAFALGRADGWWQNLNQQYAALTDHHHLQLIFTKNEAYVDDKIGRLSQILDQPPARPELKLSNGEITVSKGKTGRRLDKKQLKKTINNQLANNSQTPIKIPVETIGKELTDAQQVLAKTKSQSLLGKKLMIKFENQNWQFENDKIFELLTVSNGFEDYLATLVDASGDNVLVIKDLTFGENGEGLAGQDNVGLQVDPERVAKISAAIATEVDRPAKNALFQFEQGKVIVFQPSIDGQKVDQQKLTNLISTALLSQNENQLEINLPITITPATVKTAEVNNLGIKELIARGVSNFAGSSAERTHNIKLATSRINGTLLAPGATFSFNNTVGEISQGTGYTTAYIISKGRTIWGEGGGVCQVSTTLFRAALNSGLPIAERFAHSYRVSYYEQDSAPGIDATVFVAPNIDLKFRNDTSAHILIQGYTQGTSLYFDFYGTKDGRIVKTSGPVVSNVVPAPAPAYEEDPTLPKGVTKQIDFAAVGANVKITRTVEKDGQIIINDTFISKYKPWQAVFKVGTKES